MRISVILPARNEGDRLADCLTDLAAHHPAEVIVADGGSTDDTVAIARQLGVRVVQSRAGRRGEQLNRAVSYARGDVLLFLHADCRLPRYALDRVERCLTDPTIVAGCFTMRLDRDGWVYRAVALAGDAYCRATHTLFGDRAIFVRRAAFERVGGFRNLAVMEEVDLGRRLRRLGRLALLPGPVVSSARQFERQGLPRLCAKIAIACAAFELGVSPDWIARFYYGTTPSAPQPAPAVTRAS